MGTTMVGDPAPPSSSGDVPAPTRARLLGTAALAGLAVALAGLTVALDVAHRDVAVPAAVELQAGWLSALAGLAQLVPGALLLYWRGRHPLALVLTGSGLLWLAVGLAETWVVHAVYAAPGAPGAAAAFWFVTRAGSALLLGLPLVLLLFPDGRLPTGRWWHALSIAAVCSTALVPVTLLLVPAEVVRSASGATDPPELAVLPLDALSVPLPIWPAVLPVVYALMPVSLVVPLVVVVARYRASRGERRLQLRWLAWAALVDAVLVLAGELVPSGPFGLGTLVAAVAVTSGAIVVAVTRYRLYEIDRLLPTTVVSLLLAVLVGAVDVVLVLLAGAVLDDRDEVLVAIAVVAVAYTPLRTRLWRLARRLVHGGRDDPYGALSTLGDRLESAAEPEQQLTALAGAVASAFRVPYVRVEVDQADGGRAAVEVGRPVGDTVELPVRYRDEPIGRVVLCSIGRGRLSRSDQRLLGELLRQGAAAVRATALGTSLQRARADLVAAREEERRRLRRDLHDSLGPGLGAVTLRVETARALAATDPAAADGVLETVTTDVAGLLADLRRMVHDLRPPALDELGLLGALRGQAGRLSGDGLTVEVHCDDPELDRPGRLPAAVEVATYRIVSEALTNVVRHSEAGHASVTVHRRATTMEVLVADDGCGIAPDVEAGVGTLSLRERAGELGGSATVSCPPGGGTVVTARLPLGDHR